jgi:hypothetical protein
MNEEKERSEKYGELRYDTPGEEAAIRLPQAHLGSRDTAKYCRRTIFAIAGMSRLL